MSGIVWLRHMNLGLRDDPAAMRASKRHRHYVEVAIGEMLAPHRVVARLAFSPQGKPCLAGVEGWFCSYSHTGSDLLVALTQAGAVGVDIEYQARQVARISAIASKHLHPLEQEWLARAEDPTAQFLRIWCLKEAWVKALGVGIAGQLRTFSTVNEHGEVALVGSANVSPGALAAFMMSAVQAGCEGGGNPNQLVAAIAVLNCSAPFEWRFV